MLSQGSYGVYPADNVMFIVNIGKAKLSSHLLVPYAFSYQVLVSF